MVSKEGKKEGSGVLDRRRQCFGEIMKARAWLFMTVLCYCFLEKTDHNSSVRVMKML